MICWVHKVYGFTSKEGGGWMGSYLVKHAKCLLLIALFYEEEIRCAYLLCCNKFVNQSCGNLFIMKIYRKSCIFWGGGGGSEGNMIVF